MSQRVVAAPEYDMSAWSQQSHPSALRQDSSSAHARPNGHVNSSFLQRVGSNQSNDPYGSYSTTSFNHNHPTPTGSGDDAIHSPEIQDLYWQETYNEDSGHMLDESLIDGANSASLIDPLRSARNSLPSPQSTNTATPDAAGHSQDPSMNGTIFTSPLSSPLLQTMRPLTSLNTNMAEAYDPASHLHTPAVSSTRLANSPSIRISKHSRGDSPARSDFEVPRFGKKRSASNLSQGGYFPDVSAGGHATMLAPPNQDDLHVPDDDDEQQRGGVNPAHRNDQEVSSFDDMDRQQEHEQSVSEVQNWLQQTTLDPTAAERRRAEALAKPDRIRSRSTGARPRAAHIPILAAQEIPGPGCLIDVESDYYYSSDSEHSLDADDHPTTHPTEMPPKQDGSLAPEHQEPLPNQFFRPRPFQDPFLTRAPDDSIRYQPDTSNAAMYEFMKKAKDSETASRAATWGTSRRRLSDGDKDSIAPGDLVNRHASLSKKARDRGTSILREVQSKAKEQFLKRSNSHQKRQQQQLHEHPELEPVQSPEPIEERTSSDSAKQTRQASYPRPMSPSISAGLLGATSSLTAIGASSTSLALETDHHSEGLIRRTMRRVRSRSDVNKSPKSPIGSTTGFTSMLMQQGGMPVPSLASPTHDVVETPSQHATQVPPSHPTVVENIGAQARSPVTMPLSPQSTQILPTLDGFRVQIRELNPRLEPYLMDRVALDQIRRYKRLVKSKVDHISAVAGDTCPSGALCPDMGGEAELLPTRPGGQHAPVNSAQFKIAPGADSDNEDSVFDGIVTPAAFPPGIPLPPTKKLPARFECPLCFQVKSFQKPSDWTKHVHEDVQPFTCTFPNCPEPKSFKRKADWVRHENERHRHPEWWKCNINDCTHQCYRKDNFVQHLVREHKRKEPKVKGRSNANGKGRGRNSASGFNQEDQEFWNLVDASRHEGATDARSEPCKFCNNHCASWKKLSVHVGKHMEQIAMPVLELARRRNVTKDTIISPVEAPVPQGGRGMAYLSTEHSMVSDIYSATSPHTQSGASNYQSSSAGHSPMVPSRAMGQMSNQVLFPTQYATNGMRPGTMGMGTYPPNGFSHGPGYPGFVRPETAMYHSYGGGPMMYGRAQLSPDQYGPQLQGMDGTYASMNSAFETSPHPGHYSSPVIEQAFPYAMNVMEVNGNMQGMATAVTSQPMNGNMYVYAAQQGNPQAPYTPY